MYGDLQNLPRRELAGLFFEGTLLPLASYRDGGDGPAAKTCILAAPLRQGLF